MDHYIDREIAAFGTFEEITTDLFEAIVQPGMCVIDVGANIGYYSLLAAQQVGTSGHVFAFEPLPAYLSQLHRHVIDNDMGGSIAVIPLGLSDAPGSANLTTTEVSSTIYPIGPRQAHWTTSMIELVTLDAFCDQNAVPPIDLIKIDVDGHEPKVIKGAIQRLTKDHPILLIEFSEQSLVTAGSSVHQLRADLLNLGYILWSERKRLPFPDEDAFLSECGSLSYSANVWAFHPNGRHQPGPPFKGSAFSTGRP